MQPIYIIYILIAVIVIITIFARILISKLDKRIEELESTINSNNLNH